MAAVDPTLLVPLVAALLGAAMGGLIAYRSALGLKKRDEKLMRDAIRRQLRDLFSDIRARFVSLSANPMARFVDDDPGIAVLLERGFGTDSARSLSFEDGRIVQAAILRSRRIASGD